MDNSDKMRDLKTAQKQFLYQQNSGADPFSGLGEETFSLIPHDNQQLFNQDQSQNTQELFGEYQNLLSGMRSKANNINEKLSSTPDQVIQRGEQLNQYLEDFKDENAHFSKEKSTKSLERFIKKEYSPHINSDKMQSNRESNLNKQQLQLNSQFQQSTQQNQHPSLIQSKETSPKPFNNIPFQNNKLLQQDLQNKCRKVLSQINLKDQNSDRANSQAQSQQYKFIHSSSTSPINKKILTSSQSYININNKENYDINYPLSNKKIECEAQYYDQVKINKQLNDQIQDLKAKQQQIKQQCQLENDIKNIKLIQNEEYLLEKCEMLENENQELQEQLQQLNNQVEGSLRSNQDLEIHLENYEVGAQQFNEKQKYFNKKIQDLLKRNSEFKLQNQEMEGRIKQLEHDKTKLSEKWVRLSAKIKVEEKNKSKVVENQMFKEQQNKELEICKQKNETTEKENSFLKEKINEQKQKCLMQQTIVKELQGKLEEVDTDKQLIDKVTNKLLQRIQRHEEDYKNLQQANQQKEQKQLQENSMKMIQLSSQIQQMTIEITDIQNYSIDLEKDNERLAQELQQYMQQDILKDQQIENLQQQTSHQIEEFKMLQNELQNFSNNQKRNYSDNINPKELQIARKYLMKQLSESNFKQEGQIINQNHGDKDQSLDTLVVYAAQKIQSLNNIMQALQQQMEEISCKYDKLARKYFELKKSNSYGSNFRNIVPSSKDAYENELQKQNTYIGQLEEILQSNEIYKNIKANQETNEDLQQNYIKPPPESYQQYNMLQESSIQPQPSQQHFVGIFSGSTDTYENQLVNYHTLPSENSNQVNDAKSTLIFQTNSTLKDSQQYNQSQPVLRNAQIAERFSSNGSSLDFNSLISYDHSKICLPTVLIKSQNQKKEVPYSNKQEFSETACLNDGAQTTLQNQIKQQLIQQKSQTKNTTINNQKYIRKLSSEIGTQRRNSQSNAIPTNPTSKQQPFWTQRAGSVNEVNTKPDSNNFQTQQKSNFASNTALQTQKNQTGGQFLHRKA